MGNKDIKVEDMTNEELLETLDIDNMSDEEILQLTKEQAPQQPTARDYWLPSFITKATPKFQGGARNVYGDIGERAGAANRAGLIGGMAQKPGIGIGADPQTLAAYQQASVDPSRGPSFQSTAIDKSQTSPSASQNVLRGTIPSAIGLASDIASNPADMFLALMPHIPTGTGKTLVQALSKTKAAQALGKFVTKERHIPFFNDRWLKAQAKTIQTVSRGMDDVLKSGYDDIYKPYAQVEVDPTKIDDILLKYKVPDYVIQEIDDVTGGSIKTVQQAKATSDILRKRVPKTLWAGKGRPRGGITNPQVSARTASRDVKQVIYDAIKNVDNEASISLQGLDDFASKNVYPKIDKLSSMVGGKYTPEPSTTGVAGVFRGQPGLATERQIIRETPKTLKRLRSYLLTDYKGDIQELYKSSKHIIKSMSAYQKRQMLRKGAGIATRAGIYGGLGYGAVRKFTGGGD